MKHTIIAVILLILLVGFIVTCSIGVSRTCRELQDTLSLGAESVRAKFDAARPMISMCVHNKLVEGAETALLKLETYETGTPEYKEAEKMFVFYCTEMTEDLVFGSNNT